MNEALGIIAQFNILDIIHKKIMLNMPEVWKFKMDIYGDHGLHREMFTHRILQNDEHILVSEANLIKAMSYQVVELRLF